MFRRAGQVSPWIARVALAAALGFAAPYAMAQQTAQAQMAQVQTVGMWTFLSPSGKTSREVALKQMIDGFEAAHPGVKIAAHQTSTAPDAEAAFDRSRRR